MNQKKFLKTWYASEKKIKSITKMFVFDDSGSLEISDDVIQFKGFKNDIIIKKAKIKDIALVRQNINWVMYILINAFFLFYIKSNGGDIMDLNLLMYFVVGNLLGLTVGINTKWVSITYGDNGIDKKIYFANAEMFGWAGIFNGTKKIYESLVK